MSPRLPGRGCGRQEEGLSPPGLHRCALWPNSFPGREEGLFPCSSPVREKKPGGAGHRGSKSKRPAPSTLPLSSELGMGGGALPALSQGPLPTLLCPEEVSRIPLTRG